MPVIDSSELTKFNQEKAIYADIFAQQQLFAAGAIPFIRYQTGTNGDNNGVISGFTAGSIKLNNPTVNNTNAAVLAGLSTTVKALVTKFVGTPTLTSVTLGALTAYSGNLTSAWTITMPAPVTVRYYQGATSNPTGLTLVAIQNKTAGNVTDTLTYFTPLDGNYYFVGVTLVGKPQVLSAGVYMPYPVPTGVEITDLTYTSANLSATWVAIPASAVNVQYYLTTSVYPSGGTPVGSVQSISSGTLTNTLSGYTPVPGKFYYVGVTPSGGTETFSPIAAQMPYALVSGVSMKNLTSGSTNLSSSWSILPSTALVTVRYYVTTSAFASDGSQVGSTQSPATGVLANTLSFSPVAGSYYYVGVTGPSGSEVLSDTAIQMPYPIVSGVSIGTLAGCSTSLSASWTVTPSSSVIVNYYVNSINTVSCGSLLQSQTVSSTTRIASYTGTLVAGKYYYVGVSPVGGVEVFSTSASQMPYPLVSYVTLNPLSSSTTTLGGSWTVLNASAVTVKYYSTNSTAIPTGAKTQVGTTQSVASGVTKHTLTGFTPVSGTYYYMGVTPTGGAEVLSSVATYKDAAVTQAAALASLSDSSTALTANWALNTPANVAVKFYAGTSTATSGTQVGSTQNVASGTTTITLPGYTPVPGTYYFVGVTPSGGSEALSSVAQLMPFSIPSKISLGNLTTTSIDLAASWAMTSPKDVVVQYYYNSTNTTNGGTKFGSSYTVTAGTTLTSLYASLVAGRYYFVGITVAGRPEVRSTYTVLMPYPIVSGVTLNALTTASVNLVSSWTVSPASAVTVVYYSTNSTTVPATGGTTVGTSQNVASGTTVNSLNAPVTPVGGTYYYVGVTPSGGVEVRSPVALLMPYAMVSGVVMNALDPGTVNFSANWNLTVASDVYVKFYMTTSPSIPSSKTQAGTTQTVTSGTTSLTVSFSTLSYTIVPGTYYFVGVKPTAASGVEVFSSRAFQFPYTTAATVQLTGLISSSTTLSSSWGVSPASIVNVRYYQATNSSGKNKTQVGSTQTVPSGTLVNTCSPPAAPITGYYYAAGVTPTGAGTVEAMSSYVQKP